MENTTFGLTEKEAKEQMKNNTQLLESWELKGTPFKINENVDGTLFISWGRCILAKGLETVDDCEKHLDTHKWEVMILLMRYIQIDYEEYRNTILKEKEIVQ